MAKGEKIIAACNLNFDVAKIQTVVSGAQWQRGRGEGTSNGLYLLNSGSSVFFDITGYLSTEKC